MADHRAPVEAADGDLRAVLGRALAARTGSAPVVDVERRRSEYASSYDAEIVSVGFAGGERLELFLKDFGVCRYEKDRMDRRRVREWHVYRDLLAGAGLGTPEYLGVARDDEGDRFWLLLELVDAVQVKHCHLDAWLAATAWLGRMHTHFAAGVSWRRHDCLVRHDEELLAVPAQRALRATSAISASLARRVRAVADAYAEALPAMVAQPLTLVHGGFRPQNVLVAGANGSSRIVAVDWEEAGIGSRFSDVAYFVDGFDDVRRARLLDAYREGAGDAGALGGDADAAVLVDCFGLWKNLATLGKAVDRGFPLPAVEKLVGIVERLAARVAGGGPPRSAAIRRRSPETSVERLVALRHGAPVAAATTERRPSPFATLARAEVISTALATGERVSVFVKEASASDHPDKRRPDREIAVYEQLLGEASLPVPALYGVVRERPSSAALVLEHVDDWDLRYQGLEHWETAARELARLHAWFAARPGRLDACPALLRLDAGYLRAWARRAHHAVAGWTPELLARLGAVLRDHEAVAGLLARQPGTLVHNDLSPKNVMADRSRDPARICFVDWEMAGVGCGMLDLVHLRYGLDEDAGRELERLYLDGVAGSSLAPDGEGERRRLVAACELHGAIYRLAHAPAWRSSPDAVASWIGEAEGFHAAVVG